MKYATIKVSFEENKSFGTILSKVTNAIVKGETKNGIVSGKSKASFVVSEVDIEKKEREIRHEQINGVNYLIIKSNV